MASFVAQEVNVPIANGKVCFTVTDWVEGQSSKGDPMITVSCNCVDGSYCQMWCMESLSGTPILLFINLLSIFKFHIIGYQG